MHTASENHLRQVASRPTSPRTRLCLSAISVGVCVLYSELLSLLFAVDSVEISLLELWVRRV